MERPLMVFIVGTTAVGKTKLSIEICKALGGEVVNCDSKQLYKYANIMTAKADAQEMQGVPHHMLDVLQLNQSTYNRNKYFSEALKSLNDIKARGKVPVIVGGTNYYLQTLLYDLDIPQNNEEYQEVKQERIQAQEEKNRKSPDKSKIVTKEMIQNMTKQQKYAKLKQVDPVMAQKVHRNDQTRTTTFLTRYAETGVAPSINYKPQIHKLRNKQNILFWIRNSNKQQLHELMTKRINKMVDGGGLVQTLAIFKYADMHGLLRDMKMGALQSIGYKQFKQVYQEVRDILSNQQFDSQVRQYPQIYSFVEHNIDKVREKIESVLVRSIRNHTQISILQRCKEILIKNTIDYSKKQVTWIKNRLFSCQQNRSNFFVLELSNKRNQHKQLMARFDEQVKTKALQILNKIKQDGVGSVQENTKEFNTVKHQNIGEWKKYYCQHCQVEVNGGHQWAEHLRSRRHRGASSKKERKYQIKNKKEYWQRKKEQQANPGKQQDQQKQKFIQNQSHQQKQKQQKNGESQNEQQNIPYKKKSER